MNCFLKAAMNEYSHSLSFKMHITLLRLWATKIIITYKNNKKQKKIVLTWFFAKTFNMKNELRKSSELTWVDGVVVRACVHALVVRGQRATLVLHRRYPTLNPLQLRVQEECTESTGHRVVRQEPQVVVVELKCQRELAVNLTRHTTNNKEQDSKSFFKILSKQ